jgi:hypothetical protein
MKTKPITLDDIFEYQKKKLKQAIRTHQTGVIIYAETLILEIIKEHQLLIKHTDEVAHVTMSPERFKLIENIRVKVEAL